MSVGHWFDTGICNQILSDIYFKTICSDTFAQLHIEWSSTNGAMF